MSLTDQRISDVFYSLLLTYPEFGGNFDKLAEFACDMSRLEQFFSMVKPVTTNHDLIRIGGETDGGYLIPDDLEGVETCFSPGVAVTASFETEIAGRGIKCFLADYSVDGAPIENNLFHFEKRNLGNTNDSVNMTLEDWVERNAPDQCDMLLQMDIEGCEYPIICGANVETLRKFRIIVIEFHGLHRLCDKQGFETIFVTFRKLLDVFDIVHIHPNNCNKPLTYGIYEIPPVLEITFLRKDRVLSRQPATVFPHKLDRTNVPGDDFPLPTCWYISALSG